MQTQSLVTVIPWTFIAQILNLFIQVYLIKRFLFKPVQEIIRKRREMTDQEINGARKAREEAESMKSEYENSLSTARGEAARIIDKAEKYAQNRTDQMILDAENEVKSIKAKAETDIQQERKKAINEMKDEIGSLAMELAGKVVEREIQEKDHRRLISEFIERVEDES